jgi:hypothetical protein
MLLDGRESLAWRWSSPPDRCYLSTTIGRTLHPSSSLKMAPYNPMKKHMDKLDEWGSAASKKYTSTRDSASGSSVTDRFNLARGKDDRWERTKPASAEVEDQTNIVPKRAGRVDHLPQSPPSLIAKVAPPPPPQRGLSGSGAPSSPARLKAPAPPLPRRMDNEAGTDRPPPAYGSGSLPTSRPGYIEFSKFTNEDKQAFFLVLDEVSIGTTNDLCDRLYVLTAIFNAFAVFRVSAWRLICNW